MTTRVQTLRSTTAGLRPSVGARTPGEFYVNFPDAQFGVIDALKTPIDLLPVRYFSTLASYFPGAYARNNGFLYRCIANVSPGAFNPAQWSQVFSAADVVGVYMPIAGGTFTGPIFAPIGSFIDGYVPASGGVFTGPVNLPPGSNVAGYMPLTGGVFSGPIIVPGGSTIVGYMPVSGGDFTGAIHAPTGSTIVGYLPLGGGTLSGLLTLALDPSDPMDAATKQYVDDMIAAGGGGGGPVVGAYLPLVGGTMTGPILMQNTGMTFDDVSGGANRVISSSTGGVKRWDLVLGTSLGETGANAGMNFGVIAYDDSGVQLSSWNTNRASGRLTFNGVNAPPHSVTNYPPDIGSATIVLNRSGSGHNCGVVASSGGLNRWGLSLSDATPETGGNSGSNFSISGIADDGHAALGVLDINRMSMRMTLNGVGAAVHSLTTYPPNVGSATMVLNRQGSGHNCGIIASSAGLNRWSLNIGDANAEGSGDNGSDFDITGFKNDGKTPLAALNILRANGRVSLNGVNATPRSITQYPPLVGGATIVLNAARPGESSLIASASGLNRWLFVMNDGTPETGAQAGANASIQYCNDAGAVLGVAMSMRRSSGQCTFPVPIVNGSDITMKTDIEPVRDALDIVSKLEGVFYKRHNSLRREVGLIAQEVAPALPEVVFETGQPIDDQGKAIENVAPLLGISYANIVAVLINAVKELTARVQELEAMGAPR